MISSGVDIVDEMIKYNATGNVIPLNWYKTITRDNNKPNLNAITILSDIVYWYKPVVVRNEETGDEERLKKKFKGDLLQRSYQSYAEQFGISKREATNAIIALEKIGVIKRCFRTIETEKGVVLNNVLFIELNPQVLFKLTYHKTFQSDTSHFKKREVPTLKSGTDTENTNTENTTNNIIYEQNEKKDDENNKETSSSKKNLDSMFDLFWQTYPKKRNKVTAKKAFIKINPDAELFKRMIESLHVFKRSNDWRKNQGQYIPYPSSWLNGRRWEDEDELIENENGGNNNGQRTEGNNTKGFGEKHYYDGEYDKSVDWSEFDH